MRNLDECQAEVFRRSEKRIRERKKRRNRILSVCVPLVLCAAGVALLPELGTNSPAEVPATEMVINQYSLIPESGSVDVVNTRSIAVSGNGFSHEYTAQEDVEEILGILARIAEGPVLVGEETAAATQDDASDLQASPEEKGWCITIRSGTQQDVVYTLVGSRLTNETTGEAYDLDGDTHTALIKALGI